MDINKEPDTELLEKMKLRILRSFRWKEDVVDPLAKELDIETKEFEKILMNKLDMSSLEALHATFESAKPQCIADKFHIDLRLCWLTDVLGIIPEKESEIFKMNLVKEVLNGADYELVLKKGKKQVLDILLL